MPLADCESARLVEALGNLLRQHTIERDEAMRIIEQQDVELARLRAIETAAQTLAAAADALLDVTVASTPNTRLSSVAPQIGALNRAWKEYQDVT